VHALVCCFLQNLLDLLVGFSHVVFILTLDVQVKLTTAHLGLLARFDIHSA
jgi:hypothetical protein